MSLEAAKQKAFFWDMLGTTFCHPAFTPLFVPHKLRKEEESKSEECCRRYSKEQDPLVMVPGAQDVLSYVVQQGWKNYMTSTYMAKDVLDRLNKAGAQDLFSGVSDGHKPSPYVKTELLGKDWDGELWVIGDDYSDYRLAKNIRAENPKLCVRFALIDWRQYVNINEANGFDLKFKNLFEFCAHLKNEEGLSPEKVSEASVSCVEEKSNEVMSCRA